MTGGRRCSTATGSVATEELRQWWSDVLVVRGGSTTVQGRAIFAHGDARLATEETMAARTVRDGIAACANGEGLLTHAAGGCA
ncbi:hypothetical protein SESBI_10080 [Sesbania bispinosa]|nr:hypothetical protein SESBI_10080 [Sesbania bispinosa]